MRNSGYDRADDDWYVEPPWVVNALIDRIWFDGVVLDPACGAGNIPKTLKSRGIQCVGSDLIDRGYEGAIQQNFFESKTKYDSIVSNPPYNVITDWIDHSLSLTTDKVAILARLAFLEGKARKEWFKKVPLKYVLVSSRRVSMPPGVSKTPAKGGSIAFAWFVFQHGYQSKPMIDWV